MIQNVKDLETGMPVTTQVITTIIGPLTTRFTILHCGCHIIPPPLALSTSWGSLLRRKYGACVFKIYFIDGVLRSGLGVSYSSLFSIEFIAKLPLNQWTTFPMELLIHENFCPSILKHWFSPKKIFLEFFSLFINKIVKVKYISCHIIALA